MFLSLCDTTCFALFFMCTIILLQYHFILGITLYNATKSSNVDDIMFSMTDQVSILSNDTDHVSQLSDPSCLSTFFLRSIMA